MMNGAPHRLLEVVPSHVLVLGLFAQDLSDLQVRPALQRGVEAGSQGQDRLQAAQRAPDVRRPERQEGLRQPHQGHVGGVQTGRHHGSVTQSIIN